MAKLKGLGRGLDALLSGDTPAASDRLLTLPVSALKPGPYQPRTRMDQGALEALAVSIREQGIMQPILVRKNGAQYEIIAGERRWRAAQLAGLSEVPVLLRDVEDRAVMAMALIENIQRESLNPLEEAAGLERLIREFGMTHEAAAKAVGRSRAAVSNLLRLLHLSKPVRELLMDGAIDMGHARALLSLPAAKQHEAAYEIADRGLSVREAERLAARLARAETPVRRAHKDRDVLRLEEALAEKLGVAVSITAAKSGAGRLTIRFADLDQLDELLKRIA